MSKKLINKFKRLSYLNMNLWMVLLAFMISVSYTLFDFANSFKYNLEGRIRTINNYISGELAVTNFIFKHIAEQASEMIANNKPVKDIERLLLTFDHTNNKDLKWTNFIIINNNFDIIAFNGKNSSQGINLSYRKYIRDSKVRPNYLSVGTPVKGIISEINSIPVALGFTDKNNNYLGSVISGISIEKLNQEIKKPIPQLFKQITFLNEQYSSNFYTISKIDMLNKIFFTSGEEVSFLAEVLETPCAMKIILNKSFILEKIYHKLLPNLFWFFFILIAIIIIYNFIQNRFINPINH
jgi:hypothetical protein